MSTASSRRILRIIFLLYEPKNKKKSDLFEPDNIKDGVSIRKVESWGGIQGVLEKLDVKVKDGIDTHAVTDISARQMEYENKI